MKKILFLSAIASMFIASSAYAHCGSCGAEGEHSHAKKECCSKGEKCCKEKKACKEECKKECCAKEEKGDETAATTKKAAYCPAKKA